MEKDSSSYAGKALGMTDQERVLQIYPKAMSEYWQGAFWIIWSVPKNAVETAVILGSGDTDEEAWGDALFFIGHRMERILSE
jgi:hypothetical protein